MIVKVAENIISPLGLTTDENFARVEAKESVIRRYEGVRGIPEPFAASLFGEGVIEGLFAEESRDLATQYTLFEKAAILSVQRALAGTADTDPASERVLFIVSTTKGNVDLLGNPAGFDPERAYLGAAASAISRYFGNPNRPVVVSNACASGACAQLAAWRYINAGICDTAIVVGADVQSKFIVTGFQSFKALAPEACRPFDSERCGLNPGEAAATIIYTRRSEAGDNDWVLVKGAIRNDANHISGPSRTGEGCYRALQQILQGEERSRIAVVSAHGTATGYNDEMESIAIARAGLLGIPVNSLKGYYGHTMGAAGILETLLTQRALEQGIVLGTRGFRTHGVSEPITVTSEHQRSGKRQFIKMLSGFGGCNAALLFKQGGEL